MEMTTVVTVHCRPELNLVIAFGSASLDYYRILDDYVPSNVLVSQNVHSDPTKISERFSLFNLIYKNVINVGEIWEFTYVTTLNLSYKSMDKIMQN